jgi:hypothetical protein
MNVADHYTYRIHWSAADQAYVGTVAEMPSMSWVAADQTEAFLGIGVCGELAALYPDLSGFAHDRRGCECTRCAETFHVWETVSSSRQDSDPGPAGSSDCYNHHLARSLPPVRSA